MIDIKNIDWLSLLPDSLRRDKYIRALSKVFNTQINKIAEELDSVIIYPNIQNQPVEMTDMLSEDFNVKWYIQDYSLEAKRDIIQNSIKVHRKKGTPYAVETAIKAIHGGAAVQEWFEYGGKPYHFMLDIDANKIGITEERFDQLLRQLIHLKNKRSYMERTSINIYSESQIYCGAAYAGVVMSYTAIETEINLMDELENYLVDENGVRLTADHIISKGNLLDENAMYLFDEDKNYLSIDDYEIGKGELLDENATYLVDEDNNTLRDWK